jgi:lipopolysaccharide biosynthesis glycosyltransferase
LDRRWNFFDHFATPILGMPDREWPGILHFVGNQKPWKAGTRSVNAGLYEVFRRRTRFPRGENGEGENGGGGSGVRNV